MRLRALSNSLRWRHANEGTVSNPVKQNEDWMSSAILVKNVTFIEVGPTTSEFKKQQTQPKQPKQPMQHI
jgi:hypothetical protein